MSTKKLTTAALDPTGVGYPAGDGSALVNVAPANDSVGPTKLGSGIPVKYGYAESTAYSAITATIPFDDTLPQITEGGPVVSLAYSPIAVGNKLLVDVVVPIATNGASQAIVALFKGSAADAIVSASQDCASGATTHLKLRKLLTVDALGSVTYSVRAGAASGNSYINGQAAARKLGGALTASITITEFKA